MHQALRICDWTRRWGETLWFSVRYLSFLYPLSDNFSASSAGHTAKHMSVSLAAFFYTDAESTSDVLSIPICVANSAAWTTRTGAWSIVRRYISSV